MERSSKISTYNRTTQATIDAKVLSAAQQISLKVQNILKVEILDQDPRRNASRNPSISHVFFKKHIDEAIVLSKTMSEILVDKVIELASRDLSAIEDPLYSATLAKLSVTKHSFPEEGYMPTPEKYQQTVAEFWYSQGMPQVQELVQQLNESFTPEVMQAYSNQLTLQKKQAREALGARD